MKENLNGHTADSTMRIGALARGAGVNVQTVRYYERRGLLDDPRAKHDGYREYHNGTLERLLFIKRAQELGFTLNEISELLALRMDPDAHAEDVKARALSKIHEIDARMRDLKRIKDALTHLAGLCNGGQAPASDCPLLDALGPIHAHA